MKQIKDLISSTYSEPSETPSNEYNEQDKRNIQEIFLLIKANYGNKFTSRFTTPEEVKILSRIWLASLAGTHRDHLQKALLYCFQICEWPPELSQFLDHLKKVQSDSEVTKLMRLPRPGITPSSKNTARMALDNLRSRLSARSPAKE